MPSLTGLIVIILICPRYMYLAIISVSKLSTSKSVMDITTQLHCWSNKLFFFHFISQYLYAGWLSRLATTVYDLTTCCHCRPSPFCVHFHCKPYALYWWTLGAELVYRLNPLWTTQSVVLNSLWTPHSVVLNSLWTAHTVVLNSLWTTHTVVLNSLWITHCVVLNSLRNAHTGVFKL